MVRIAEEEFLANRQEQMIRAIGRAINNVATVTPVSVIKQVEFRVYGEGLYNLRSVRASVDGMAEGCILATGDVTENKVSHTIDTWTIDYIGSDRSIGDLVATLGTFGIPSGHTGKPEENKFSIHLMLVDNQTTIDYDFNIGDILTEFNELDGSNGELQKVVVKLRLPERLPDVKPVDGEGGGFDIDFDGWGDEIVTVIPS